MFDLEVDVAVEVPVDIKDVNNNAETVNYKASFLCIVNLSSLTNHLRLETGLGINTKVLPFKNNIHADIDVLLKKGGTGISPEQDWRNITCNEDEGNAGSHSIVFHVGTVAYIRLVHLHW